MRRAGFRPLRLRWILASASPRRVELLRELGVSFTVRPSRIPEKILPGESPRALVVRLARSKAQAVARRWRGGRRIVLGADTDVVLDGKILGKPKSPRDAARMLLKLCGRTHRVYSGVALVDTGTGLCKWGAAVSAVTLRKITPEEALRIGSKHLDKSGSYASQDPEDRLVRKIRGDWRTVVGLPVSLVKRLAQQLAKESKGKVVATESKGDCR